MVVNRHTTPGGGDGWENRRCEAAGRQTRKTPPAETMCRRQCRVLLMPGGAEGQTTLRKLFTQPQHPTGQRGFLSSDELLA